MRTILNLKYLKKHVACNHFGMESFLSFFTIIQPNSGMTSLALKDASYGIPILKVYCLWISYQKMAKHFQSFQELLSWLRFIYIAIKQTVEKMCLFKPRPILLGSRPIQHFLEKWSIYAFPPFSKTDRSISKIIRDKSTAIMIIPLWPTGTGFH